MPSQHCGCQHNQRIVLDDQILEEKEVWKQKFGSLQRQTLQDVARLKQNIYAECASLMQTQFLSRDAQHTALINEKNQEIKNITSQSITLEARVKILERENQVLIRKNQHLQKELQERDRFASKMRGGAEKLSQQYVHSMEERLSAEQSRSQTHLKGVSEEKDEEISKLRQKIREFEKKYQLIIPEVERLKINLTAKTQLAEQLQIRLQKLKKESARDIEALQSQKVRLEKSQLQVKLVLDRQNYTLEQLSAQVERSRKMRQQVRVEPLYIDRPVQVEKIIERLVEKEKIVKQYIQPPATSNTQSAEEENVRLKQQINSLISQSNSMEERYRAILHECENSIRIHEENTVQYKRERITLVNKIKELNLELDSVQDCYANNGGGESAGERIIVHVNKDGVFKKTVEKIEKPDRGTGGRTFLDHNAPEGSQAARLSSGGKGKVKAGKRGF